jgi:phage protein D
VVSVPFFGNGSANAVRRPVLEVGFGAGGADAWKRHLTSVTIESGFAPFADAVTLQLSAGAEAPAATVADPGTVSLGYEDGSTELVFTGQVDSVRHSVRGETWITATNGGASLSKLRVNQSYEQRKAGDIVSDLAGRAGVVTDAIEDGVAFSFYVVDDRSSAYRHIAALARKSNYLARFSPEDKLSFAPFVAGQPVQTFTYGKDIMSLQVTEAAPVVAAVTTTGEGAAGGQGQEAWSWLVKDPSSVKGSAEEGAPEREVDDPSLRSGHAAQSAAEGIASAAGLEKLTGKLLVPGAPAVSVGRAVKIADAPKDILNGVFLVRRVSHRFSKLGGFTTMIHISETGEGGLLGGLL